MNQYVLAILSDQVRSSSYLEHVIDDGRSEREIKRKGMAQNKFNNTKNILKCRDINNTAKMSIVKC